ncbi:MAG: hypothetical protein H7224_04315 [Polaromonas sp.]|nr:hypothetical protein [Polaromonas sp.]
MLEGRFSGPGEFSALVRHALATAAAQGWRELLLCDTDFNDWPLGERAVAQSLNDWAASGRKFTMLAANYDVVSRRHARFVTWRKRWSHLVECRVCGAMHKGDLPSILWSPVWALRRLDVARSAGSAGGDAARRTLTREQLGEYLLKSTPGFAATTLGL